MLTMPQIIRAMQTTSAINLTGSNVTAVLLELNEALCKLFENSSILQSAKVGIRRVKSNLQRMWYITPWGNSAGMPYKTFAALFLGLLKTHQTEFIAPDSTSELNSLITEFRSHAREDWDAALKEHFLAHPEQARQTEEATMDQLQKEMEMTKLTEEPPEDDDRDVSME